MSIEILPFRFELDLLAITGTCLWSLALYLGGSSLGEWVTGKLLRWFNFAERWLYTSQEELDRTRAARESQNAFYASLFSIVPFLGAGVLCSYGIELGLGRSWTISVGIMACIACGIYELGKRDGKA